MLPKSPLGTQDIRTLNVNEKSLINFKSNYYSVPVKLVGQKIEAHINSQEINCFYKGIEIANHIRLYGTHGVSLKLDHYLDLLKYKPGAFKGSLVLAQTKEKNEWPTAYEALWKTLMKNLGDSKGTQMLIDILLLHRTYGEKVVVAAVKAALHYGSCDISAILVLIRQQAVQKTTPSLKDLGYLQQYDRPVQDLDEYNQLLF